MSKRAWHKGPPPHVGWWNASANKDYDAWRWWNGHDWSCCVFHEEGVVEAVQRSCISVYRDPIEWTDYWPKNARVPRIKP